METEQLEILRRIEANLEDIRKLIELQTRSVIKQELEKVASTPERKMMWVLCDGNTSTTKIAEALNVSVRAVQYFVHEAQAHDLIKLDKRGYPRRIVEWVPVE